MTRKTILMVLVLLSGITATAENYPYRSDYLWLTVPNHADWLSREKQQDGTDGEPDCQ